MIRDLVGMLATNAAVCVMNEQYTAEEAQALVDTQKERYEGMTDLQLQNLIMINC